MSNVDAFDNIDSLNFEENTPTKYEKKLGLNSGLMTSDVILDDQGHYQKNVRKLFLSICEEEDNELNDPSPIKSRISTKNINKAKLRSRSSMIGEANGSGELVWVGGTEMPAAPGIDSALDGVQREPEIPAEDERT